MSDTPSDESRADGSASESYSRKVRQIRDDLDHLLHDLQGRVGEADRVVRQRLEHAERTMREGVDETETRIRESPFLAMGVAAALGFLVGLLAGAGASSSRER